MTINAESTREYNLQNDLYRAELAKLQKRHAPMTEIQALIADHKAKQADYRAAADAIAAEKYDKKFDGKPISLAQALYEGEIEARRYENG